LAKNVFRFNEVKNVPAKVHIEGPEEEAFVPAEVEEEVPEYQGPTADELRREAEHFKEQWEKEKEAMISSAKAEAEKIIKDAENVAFEEVQKKNDQAAEAKRKSEEEAAAAVEKAKKEAEEIVAEAEQKAQGIDKDAYERGFQQGKEEGFTAGKAEMERLIERLHTILSRAVERRNQIIEESEMQLVSLVLQIAKKVVKVISENQKNVVVNNVIQALRKLKSKADVIVRVNLADVKLTTEHTRDLINKIENVQNVQVLEDSSVDPGGCIIETDFGRIDARISSQLNEIEERILELVPIREKMKTP
jgi:flagellar assembly protein FliH